MSYTNITYASTTPLENYVNNNWVYSPGTTFIKKDVLARGAHFVLAPSFFITCAVDTIIGLGVGIGAFCTLGKHKPICEIAYAHLYSSNMLFVRPYVNLLQTINPEAKLADRSNFKGNIPFFINYHGETKLCITNNKPPMITADGTGYLSDLIINPLKDIGRSCYNSNNFLKRHVASRLTYALLAVSCLITRAVDGVIGVVAASLSILTGGKFESLNNLAYRTLQAPGIINDLFYCTIKFINPWTGTSKA